MAIALGCTLLAAIGTVGATPLRPAKTLDCYVGTGCCISWAMGECGQGGSPDGVLCRCRVGACTCAAVPGTAIGALTLPCELISLSLMIFTVGCPFIGHNSQGTVSQQSLLHCLTTHTIAPNPKHATCGSFKYYDKIASRVRSLVPQNNPHGSYLSFPASSCFLLRPSPLHSVFAVEQVLLAHWLHVRCFLESCSHTAHIMFSSSLERRRKLRNQLLCTPGKRGSV